MLSIPGRGTEAVVRLPLARAAPAPEVAEPAATTAEHER